VEFNHGETPKWWSGGADRDATPERDIIGDFLGGGHGTGDSMMNGGSFFEEFSQSKKLFLNF
jgi:hypothetical protein